MVLLHFGLGGKEKDLVYELNKRHGNDSVRAETDSSVIQPVEEKEENIKQVKHSDEE